jgi:hypothetical protein
MGRVLCLRVSDSGSRAARRLGRTECYMAGQRLGHKNEVGRRTRRWKRFGGGGDRSRRDGKRVVEEMSKGGKNYDYLEGSELVEDGQHATLAGDSVHHLDRLVIGGLRVCAVVRE